MKKRVFCTLLALCFFLSLLPMRALGTEEPAPAAETPCPTSGCSLPEGHEGEHVPYETIYQTPEDGTAYGTLAEACENVKSGGMVLVLRDIELEAGVQVTKPMTITSYGDTPYTITYSPKDRGDYLLTIQLPVTNPRDYPFCLTNIILDGGREQGYASQSELVLLEKGALMLETGAVIQNNDNVCTAGAGAGGLRFNGGMLYLNTGAAIRNCRGVLGGGVTLAGDGGVQMAVNGGVIENCESFRGGGVYIAGSDTNNSNLLARLYVQHGGIINNQAKTTMEGFTCPDSIRPGYGGGIYMDRGIITMPAGSSYDGVVAGNHADQEGGGIYDYRGTLNLYSGEVTGNTARQHGGGIVTISPYGHVAVAFAPKVTGNTSGDGGNNLYLDLALDAPGEDPTAPVMVVAALSDAASIGISRHIKPDAAHTYRVVAVPYGSHTDISGDLEKFYSDDPRYVVLLHEEAGSPDDGTIVITNADVAFDNQGHGTRPPSQMIDSDHKVEEPTEPEAPGYTFGGWYTEPECKDEHVWNFTEDQVLTDEKPQVLYAKWDLIDYPITYDLQADEGDTVVNDNPVEYNIESDDITLKTPIRVGYRFLGWEEVEVTGISLFSTRLRGEEVTPDIPHGSIGARKFVARWEEAAPCTVVYADGADGAVFSSEEHADLPLWSETPAFSGGTPARAGYTFTGWSPEVTARVSGDITYTAQWRENVYPVYPDPVTPTEPDDPTDPVEPTEPDDPTEPVEPTEPDDPTEPDTPADPVTPPDGEEPPAPPVAPDPAPTPDPLPNTGDPRHTTLWAVCALVSLAGIVLVLRPRRRRR